MNKTTIVKSDPIYLEITSRIVMTILCEKQNLHKTSIKKLTFFNIPSNELSSIPVTASQAKQSDPERERKSSLENE